MNNGENIQNSQQLYAARQRYELIGSRNNSTAVSILIHAAILFIGGNVISMLLMVMSGGRMLPMNVALPSAILPIVAAIAALVYSNGAGVPVKASEVFGKSRLSAGVIIPPVLMGLGLQGAVGIISDFIERSSGIDLNASGYIIESVLGEPVPSAVMLVYVALIAPVCEELVFRGIILKSLAPSGMLSAALTSSIIFGLSHGNLLQTVFAFFVGLLFARAAQKTGSLISSVIIHIAINLNSVIMTLLGMAMPEDVYLRVYNISLTVSTVVGAATLAAVIRSSLRSRKPAAERKLERAAAKKETARFFRTAPAIGLLVLYGVQFLIITLSSLVVSFSGSA